MSTTIHEKETTTSQDVNEFIFNKDTLQSFFVEIQKVLELSLQSLTELAVLYEKELELQQKNLNTIIQYADYIHKNQTHTINRELTEEEVRELHTLTKTLIE